MAAFRPVDPLHAYTDNLGVVLAGGYFTFCETGTDTPKIVFSDEDLSVNLGDEVTLDAGGRLPSDVWVSGVVRVRLYDADGDLVAEADPVQEQGAAGSAIPAQTGNSGEFLTTNGTVMSWASIREVPDPAGNSGKFLSNDGTNIEWETLAIPEVPVGGVETGTKLFKIGGMQVISGQVTMPITGTHTTSSAVVFATPFNAAPYFVGAFNTTGGISPSGAQGTITTQGQSSTGFTINLDVNIDSVDAGWNINVGAVVQWIAFGPVDP